MNSIEEKTGRLYREWTDILPKVREELNKFRKYDLPNEKDMNPMKIPVNEHVFDDSKFKIGQFVH